MNIGIDIHGVIDVYESLFKQLTTQWANQGHIIHILTGMEWEKASIVVRESGIVYHEYFSIVDHHKSIGTDMWERTDKRGWWMSEKIWNASKGEYAESHNIGLHFDDGIHYAQYFPSECTFIYVPSFGFENTYKNILDIH